MLVGKSKLKKPKHYSILSAIKAKAIDNRLRAYSLISELVFIKDYTLADYFAEEYSEKVWWEN